MNQKLFPMKAVLIKGSERGCVRNCCLMVKSVAAAARSAVKGDQPRYAHSHLNKSISTMSRQSCQRYLNEIILDSLLV